MSLQRFKDAQQSRHEGFACALAQLRAGRKTSHWIWYIFPQLAGLGHSSAALEYAIRDRDEARDYVNDPLLRARLLAVATTVAAQLQGGCFLADLMGGRIDALKVVSSLTLFRAVTQEMIDPEANRLAVICDDVLRLADAQGFMPCVFTLGHFGA